MNKQKEAVEWVRDHRGTVFCDFEWDFEKGSIVDAELPGRPEWLRELIGIDYFADVVCVDLNDTEVKDLGPLQNLAQLEGLYLRGTQVSDLEPLRELTQLRLLTLVNTPVSDLTPLAGMKNVKIYLDEAQQVTVPDELADRMWPPRGSRHN